MSKSRNYNRRDFEYDETHHTRTEIKKMRDRRKEKRLASALKSKNLNVLTQIEDDYE